MTYHERLHTRDVPFPEVAAEIERARRKTHEEAEKRRRKFAAERLEMSRKQAAEDRELFPIEIIAALLERVETLEAVLEELRGGVLEEDPEEE